MTIDFLFDGPPDADTVVALAHGAGAAMDTPFMDGIAERLGAAGIRVARFEFPYMAKRREDGRKRGPDRPETLLATWGAVAQVLAGKGRLFIAGKSMGGRYASLYAAQPDSMPVAGIIALGYPFHPPGKPDRLRIEHLGELSAPMLIVQGERDSFGNRVEVARYALPDTPRIAWAPDGDHSLKPRKASGRSEADNLDLAADAILAFVGETTSRE